MKKSYLAIFFVLAAIAVAYYAYPILNNRYREKTKTSSESSLGANKNQNLAESGNGVWGPGGNENENWAMDNQNANADQDNNNQNDNLLDNANTDISREDLIAQDCDNGCKRFKNNEVNYRYCQEICGDIPVSPKNSEEECANFSGLDKDYCWRDLAVSKKDSSICNKISDKKFKSACRNRVAEELLN